MSERSANLLAAALQLSEEELVAELHRRAEELRQNPDAAIPWDQVKDMR